MRTRSTPAPPPRDTRHDIEQSPLLTYGDERKRGLRLKSGIMRTDSGCRASKCRTSGASGARAALALCTLLSAWQPLTRAAELRVSVLDNKGHGVAGIVIVAESATAPPATAPPAKHAAHVEVMDQHNMQFVPSILVIQTGTAVDFPNSDQIEHQVYSFSPAKSFQLSLYAGHKYPPIMFDRPGLVTVGCNIHDFMIGYIYVTNSTFFGRTDADGQLQLHGLPAGSYTLTAWHPLLQEPGGTSPQMPVSLAANDHATPVFRLTRPLRMDMNHMEDKRWSEY